MIESGGVTFAASTSEPVRRARLGLTIYFGLVIVCTAAVQLHLFRTGLKLGEQFAPVLVLMWTPGLASIVARLVLREGFADVSFRFGGRRTFSLIALAVVVPIVVGLLAYGAAWATGLATFVDKPLRFPGFHPNGVVARFACRLLLCATLGTLFGAVAAGGEEIGWRGYMLTRLVDAKVPRPVLSSGLIWGAWHVPLILTGQYAAGSRPWLSAIVFVASVAASGVLHAWVRFRSGSLWPAVAAHAGWNAIIQGTFDVHTVGIADNGPAATWVGESGVLVAIASWVVVIAVVRGARGWSMKRTPRSEAEPIAP
jgi:uncharacterized protein